MIMKCIIVEDQPPAQRIMKKYISDVDSLALIGTFTDALQALAFLKEEEVDLMFLDIHLPKMSGIEFLKTIPDPPRVILTTAFPEFALESYEYGVIDYLLKPFSFARFVQAVEKAVNLKSKNIDNVKPTDRNRDVFIKVGYEFIKVNTRDITHIKADGDYIEIYTRAKRYVAQDSLKKWTATLPPADFCRVHKSYIVNQEQILKISSNRIILNGDIEIPIGRSYKEAFEQKVLGR